MNDHRTRDTTLLVESRRDDDETVRLLPSLLAIVASALSAGPPTITIVSAPEPLTTTTSGSLTWTTASAPETTTCVIDRAAAVACASPLTLPSLSAGPHRLTITTSSTTGVSERTATWLVVDPASPPIVVIDGRPPPTTVLPTGTLRWHLFNATASAIVECAVDAATPTPCTDTFTTTALALGPHQVTVRASTATGGASVAVTEQWTIVTGTGDALAEITAVPATASVPGTATFSWQATVGVPTTCSLDGGPASACVSPLVVSAPAGAHSFTLVAGASGTTHVGYLWRADALAAEPPIVLAATGALTRPATLNVATTVIAPDDRSRLHLTTVASGVETATADTPITGSAHVFSRPLVPGQTISWFVEAANDVGTSRSAPVTVAIPRPPTATLLPRLRGVARTGKRVACIPATFADATAVTTTLLVNGRPTTRSLVPRSWRGRRLSCRSTATGISGSGTSTSAAVRVR